MSKVFRERIAAVRSGRDGAVAAEFALIAPLLFSLLMGTIEYGSVVYSMSSMQYGANVVAREWAVNRLTPAQANARLDTFIPVWLRGHTTLSMQESNPSQPRTNTVTLTVGANSIDATPIAVFTRAHPWTITAQANVQQEMPYDN